MDIIERLETIQRALGYVKHINLNIQAHPQMVHCKGLILALIEDLSKEQQTQKLNALADFAAEIFDIFFLDYTHVKLMYNRQKEHDSDTLEYSVKAVLQYLGNNGVHTEDEKKAFVQALKWRLEYKKLKDGLPPEKIDE